MVARITDPTMDRVPSVFRDRVAAFWKCCEEPHCRGCRIQRQMPDCEWTRISRKRRIQFRVGMVNGKLFYGFRDPKATDRYQSMAELKNLPNQKNVIIRSIGVFEECEVDMTANLTPLDVDMEVLMNFVTSLSNEPCLGVESSIVSPAGATLFQWIEKMYFSSIFIEEYGANFNRLLERQYSRRKVTAIVILKVNNGDGFLEAELAALRLKTYRTTRTLPIYVVDAIVRRFLVDPRQFGEAYYVEGFFAKGQMKNRLKGYEEKNQCTNENDFKFTFEGPNERILIVQKEDGGWWSLCVQAI